MKVSEGRVIVTGATRGIGRATANAIVERGGKVIAIARDVKALEALRDTAPDQVRTVAGDLGNTGGVAELAGRAIDAFGGVEGLVNCAGIVRYELVGTIAAESVEAQLRVNVVAPLLLCQTVADHLQSQGGSIVNVSSTLSEQVTPGMAAYSATKAALNALTKALARELGPAGVRVNAVLPGVVDTDMIRKPRVVPGEVLSTEEREARVEAQLEALRRLHPLGRLGTPKDIATVIVGLLDHPWQTGSLVTIDGGLSVA